MYVLSVEFCMVTKILDSFYLQWAVLCTWNHLPLFLNLLILHCPFIVTLITFDTSLHFFLFQLHRIFVYSLHVLYTSVCTLLFATDAFEKKGKKPLSFLICSALGPLTCSTPLPASARSLLCAAASVSSSWSPPLL